jgi:hypothetical protein
MGVKTRYGHANEAEHKRLTGRGRFGCSGQEYRWYRGLVPDRPAEREIAELEDIPITQAKSVQVLI